MATLAAVLLVGASSVAAQPAIYAGLDDSTGGGSRDLRGYDGAWAGGEGVNAFFYPDGYDPQYGSQGRVPDAADFAAGYGCRPIWNAKTGRTMPACN